MEADSGKYWNNYYAQRESISVPSQFSAFVLNEYNNIDRYVEFGCGDGRDALYFARHGKTVLGVDASDHAVSLCQKTAQRSDIRSAKFETLDFNNKKACTAFSQLYASSWSNALVYARFFLHAITEDAQENFLETASQFMGQDGCLCLEFRTERDRFQNKVTSDHYRRFIDPVDLIGVARDIGLRCNYMVEGFGYAKHKLDDAHVARVILTK